jgi:hypothetical protein
MAGRSEACAEAVAVQAIKGGLAMDTEEWQPGQPLPMTGWRVKMLGIWFYSEMPLWSNPGAGINEKTMPAILARAAFLDLLRLCTVIDVDDVIACNRMLRDEGEIKQRRFEVNASMLGTIREGRLVARRNST